MEGPRAMVRVLAAVEVGVGVAAFLYPDRLPAAAVGASYVLFALFVAWARRQGGALSSCGCFGVPDTPTTMLHIVLNAGFALVATVVALTGAQSALWTLLAREPWNGSLLLAGACIGAYLTFLALALLPRLDGVRRSFRQS